MPERRKCILNCPKIKGTKLFCFPKNEVRRLVWLRLIDMEYTSKVSTFLCSRHFSERMYHNTKLKNDAIPDMNLEYIENSSSNVEEESDSLYECVSYDGDSTTNLELGNVKQPVQSVSCSSTSQNPIKKVVLPKSLKIVPIKNGASDPLFVPKDELTSESITKQQMKIVNGRAIKLNPRDRKEVSIKPSGINVSTIKTDKIEGNSRTMPMIFKNRSKDCNKPPRMRAPLAPLEMRLATRIWQSSEGDSECSQKLPTLRTKERPQIFSKKSAKIAMKTVSIAKIPKSLNSAHNLVEPVAPVRVKNIHDVNETWKEQVKKVEEQTESAMTFLAETLEPMEITIDYDNKIDYSQNYTIINEPTRQNQIITPPEGRTNSVNEIQHSMNEKRSIKDLLCDEILPSDDDFSKSSKKTKFPATTQNHNSKIDLINEELFDDTIHSTTEATSSNILMMGVEDFDKLRDDSSGYETMTFISEASQTGSKTKHSCGFIEKYSHNGTFNITCFYCSKEFPIWDWQLFTEHIATEHDFETSLKNQRVGTESEISMRLPNRQSLSSYPHYTSSDLNRILPNPNIQYVLVQGDEPNTVALMPLQHLLRGNSLSGQIINSAKNVNDDNQEDSDKDVDKESHSSVDNDDFRQNDNIINLKKTDPARIMRFLEVLREHPLLWHTRRHGPTLFDEEAEKFILKFDRTVTPMNFRSSMDYLRHWYRRFIPPTTASKAKLECNSQYREYVEILNEIEELSKMLAFYCDHCPYYFLDKDRLETHKYLKHSVGDLKYACSCGLRFADVTRKDAHELSHKPKPSFMCELCGMSFSFNRSLLSHMNTKHPDVIEDPLPYKCTECDAKFPNSQSRSWHALKHAPPRFNCDLCGQSYHKSFPYKQHMKKHMDQRDYVCEDCGKAFVEKRGLINHRYRVHKAGGFHCDHCDTYYSCYEKLFVHNQLRHPNGTNTERPCKRQNKTGRERKRRSCCSLKPRIFKCKQCGTVFDRQYQLMRHKRLLGHYLGERYYKCSNCPVVCKSRVALVRHLRGLHDLPITFADVKEEDYYITTYDNDSKVEELTDVQNEDGYAVQTIACTEEENIIVQDEEIQEIFEEFEGDFTIEQVISNDPVS